MSISLLHLCMCCSELDITVLCGANIHSHSHIVNIIMLDLKII
jgi:hypothetical protein